MRLCQCRCIVVVLCSCDGKHESSCQSIDILWNTFESDVFSSAVSSSITRRNRTDQFSIYVNMFRYILHSWSLKDDVKFVISKYKITCYIIDFKTITFDQLNRTYVWQCWFGCLHEYFERIVGTFEFNIQFNCIHFQHYEIQWKNVCQSISATECSR